MKTWVLIAALAAIYLAHGNVLSEKEQIKQVLKSWKPRHDKKFLDVIGEPKLRYDHTIDSLKTGSHVSKRSVSQNVFAASVSKGCGKPGYTGDTCQYPICDHRNTFTPSNPTSDEVSIDASNLANCSESMVILIDETMFGIKIELESDSPLNPQFYIQSVSGDIINPDSDTRTPTSYIAKYEIIPPGQYILYPRADTEDEFCSMTMIAYTNIQITGGFLSGSNPERNDFPTLKYAYFDTESVVAIHTEGLSYPGVLQSIGFTGAENHVSRYVSLGIRYNCLYPYILERYTCKRTSANDAGHNFIQVEGITDAGNVFRRIMAYQCIVSPVVSTTAAPTPSPTPITTCQNDGQLLNDTSGNPYCYCFGLFTGSDCSQMICANGGYMDTPTSTRCTCPEGFSGFHCENIVCTDTSGFDFDAEHPTLTLVIRSRSELSSVIQQVADAVSEIVDKLSFEPDYLTSFIVVLFDNNKLLSSKRYDSWDSAMVDMTKAIHSAPSDGGCEDSVFSAISSALSLYPNNKSPLYVITDSSPNDSEEKETVFNLESYWRAPIYFIYVPPASADNCNTSPDSSGYRDYMDIATRTGGNAFYLSSRDNVKNITYSHMLTTLYRSQLLLSGDYTHCGQQNVYKSIAADQDTDMFVIVATGSNISFLITDPFSNYITPDVVYSDGQNYIWEKRGVVAGQWFFTVLSQNDNDACTFKVYQKKFNFAGSTQYSPDYDIFWSFTTDITSSGILRQPVLGIGSSPVFHVTNYPQFISMDRVHANLAIYAIRDGKQVEVYGSSGMWRDACEFPFYFPPFTCRVPEETLYFNFFARDRFDMSLQRAGTMYCSQIHPTPPPEHQCQNGGVMNPSNTTCFCPPQFSGTYCQDIVCYNGGTAKGDHCVCPPGYAGESCELARCTETGPDPEFLRYGVDMVFAVEVTENSLASISTLEENFQEIIRDVQHQRGWIRNFVLVGFNSTWGGPLAESPAENITAVVNALRNLATTIPTDKGCKVKLWDALDHAIFKRDVIPGSFIEIFQTTPEDDTDAHSLSTLYDMSRSMDLILYGFLSQSPRFTPNGFACNATAEDYYTLFDIVAGSTGNTYSLQPAEISNAVRLIPLQFSNGFVIFNVENDCRYDGLVTYFPVDSYTQTIQINTFGYNTTLTVFNGDGVIQEATELFYDDYTGQSAYEVRRECDEGWERLGQYCIKFITGVDNILPMPQAKNFCASAGGYLVDDLTDDKNNYLYAVASKTQFWIGLYESNNQFVWDRGQFVSPSPLDQNQLFWSDNEPSNDTSKQCVYFDGTSSNEKKTWITDSCSTPRPFVCQKHGYDVNHTANRIGDDNLSAGMWYAKLTSNPSTNNSPLCTFSARVQSSLQIVTGFTTNIGSDHPQSDPIQDSSSNRLITYVHSTDNENRVPILTDAILWDAYNGTFYNGLKYEERFGCQYSWASQDFPCPNGLNVNNEFGIVHIGEDEFGHTFQRVTFGHCSKAEITCGNGGVRQNGQCICNDYWTGTLCTVPICVNGGTRNADELSCTCPTGFTGRNCESAICYNNVGDLFDDGRKSLVFIVETTKQNTNNVDSLISNLKAIVTNATSANPLWFANYGLITFNSSGKVFEKYDYESIDDLISGLTDQKTKISDAGACSLPVMGVIGSLIGDDNQIVIPNSEIFLITTSSPSDLGSYVSAMDALFNSQAHLHYIYSKVQACPTIDAINIAPDMAWLGYGSNGNLLSTDESNIINLLSAYLPTLYGASVLQDPTGITNYTCSDSSSWFVPVDMNTTYIYATTTSEYGSLSVVDPLGRQHSPNVLYNVEEQKMYSIEVDRVPGIWTLQLISPPGLCLAHVYSTGGVKVYTRFALTNPVGGKPDPTGAHQDGRSVQPVPGFENVAVFHLYGKPYHNGQLQYAEIFDADNITNIMRSELYKREGCSYEYYSDPFTCNSDMIVVFVHGVDEYNQKFRRQEIVICNGRVPTTANPSTSMPLTNKPTSVTSSSSKSTSGNTVTTPSVSTTVTPTRGYTSLQFDVVFLIDGSQAAQDNFDLFTKFMKNLMVSFTVGMDKARVGIVVVAANSDDQAPPLAALNAITSQNLLNQYTNELKDGYTDFSHSGQLLTNNLEVVSSSQYMNDGYRSNISNHLLIYITSTTSFSSDPTTSAQTIIANKKYGIITIGYGSAVDNSKLQAISGGASCSFTASDFTTLNNVIKNNVQSLILNADSNGGTYCTNSN